MIVAAPSPHFTSKLGQLTKRQTTSADHNAGNHSLSTSVRARQQCRRVTVSMCSTLLISRGSAPTQIWKDSATASSRARVRKAWASAKRNPGRSGLGGGVTVLATLSAQNGDSIRSREETPAAVLREILAAPGVHQGPACYDALSAKLIEQAGFSYTFMSGFAISAARLGAPDVGLLSYGEVVEQGRLINASVSIPVIGDGDTGYGNALNVKRTVKGFIEAGFAGILIEDQVSPKSCGHFGRARVVSREEALIRVKAAIDARMEARRDIVIIARSDASQAESLEEALWRVERFAELGADMVFIDALSSKDEMLAFCKAAPGTPKLANMMGGGGRTPMLSPMELEELGFKLVVYPLSLLGVSIRAMQDSLKALKSGRLSPPGNLPTFDEIKDVVGLGRYSEEDEYYATIQLPVSPSARNGAPGTPVPAAAGNGQPAGRGADLEEAIPILESEVVSDIPDIQGIPGIPENSVFVEPDVLEDKDANSTKGSLSAVWSRVLRVKISGSSGDVKLDIRIPAGFLDGLSSTVPAVAGLNLQELLDDAVFKLKGKLETGQQLLDFRDRRGERIQVFLE